jgi:hypothetical protein
LLAARWAKPAGDVAPDQDVIPIQRGAGGAFGDNDFRDGWIVGF